MEKDNNTNEGKEELIIQRGLNSKILIDENYI